MTDDVADALRAIATEAHTAAGSGAAPLDMIRRQVRRARTRRHAARATLGVAAVAAVGVAGGTMRPDGAPAPGTTVVAATPDRGGEPRLRLLEDPLVCGERFEDTSDPTANVRVELTGYGVQDVQDEPPGTEAPEVPERSVDGARLVQGEDIWWRFSGELVNDSGEPLALADDRMGTVAFHLVRDGTVVASTALLPQLAALFPPTPFTLEPGAVADGHGVTGIVDPCPRNRDHPLGEGLGTLDPGRYDLWATLPGLVPADEGDQDVQRDPDGTVYREVTWLTGPYRVTVEAER